MKDKKYVSIVTGYGFDGEGICRTEGKVTFLPFVIRGEEVEYSIERENSSFCKGKLINVLSPSPLRETAPCPYFGKCGGCVYQHLDYENELEIKKRLLASQLEKIGFVGEIEVYPSLQRYKYRNKIKLFVKDCKLGLKCRNSNEIIDVKNCLLVSDKINEVIDKIRTFLSSQNLYACFDEIVIREEEEQVLVNFYKNIDKNFDFQKLFSIFGERAGIFETYKKHTIHVIGLKSLEVKEGNLDCSFKPTSFHQVNKFVMPDLYQAILDELQGDKILNCYSGAGVLSGLILSKCKKVVGVELGKSEHADAEYFKRRNLLHELVNINGDCADVISGLKEDFDCVVVDPPRAGMDKKVCDAIDKFNSQKLIYVSCDSATMTRDIKRLETFEIEKVYLFDMFACTGECETLTVLNKRL